MVHTADTLIFGASRILAIVAGLGAIAIAAWAYPSSGVIDRAAALRSHLIANESIPITDLVRASTASIPACETQARIGAALAKLALADRSLGFGKVDEMDAHLQNMNADLDAILACAPRNSFAWLAKFWNRALEGHADHEAYQDLAKSYEFGPREGWIAARRLHAAMPLYDNLPSALRLDLLRDFRMLALDGDSATAASAYAKASSSARAEMMQTLNDIPDIVAEDFDRALTDLGEAPAFDLDLRRRIAKMGPIKLD